MNIEMINTIYNKEKTGKLGPELENKFKYILVHNIMENVRNLF